MRVALLGLLAIAAAAQDQTGRIEGVVLDATSHQPVKKAAVSINFTAGSRGQAGLTQAQARQTVTTDPSGAFMFNSLPAGQYQLTIMHQSYPQARMGGVRKSVQVSTSETAAKVTVELVPGAAISGRIVDEDGDPLSGCFVQAHPAKTFNQGVPMMRVPMAANDGSYRLANIPAGKYIFAVQCSIPVFQARPLSEGPDPPPAAAYPVQYYAGAGDLKSAQIVELTPGAERSGIDFQLRPAPVTRIHGTLTAGSADWRGRNDLQAQLQPLDPRSPRIAFNPGGRIDPASGSFEIRQVFPGSYRLIVFSQNGVNAIFPQQLVGTDSPNSGDPVAAIARVDVGDKPVDISLPLNRAVDISGTVEIESNDNKTTPVAPGQISIQLTSEYQFGRPPGTVRVNDDKTFTIKSVLPGEWRISVQTNSVFLKSAWLGSEDVTHGVVNLTSGSASSLRILVSSNTATIRGTAPDSQVVFASLVETGGPPVVRSGQVDSSGQFTIPGLAPGKYRIVGLDNGTPMPEEGGQEVTLREGETTMIEVKPEPKL